MNKRLQDRCGVHHAQKQRAIDEYMIERRSVEIRRNAEHRGAPGSELNELFQAPTLAELTGEAK